MRLTILVVVVSCFAVGQCDDNSLLQDLSTFDLSKVIRGIFGTNVDSLHSVSRSRATDEDHMLRNRAYDWDKCVRDVGSIADGLNRTEMWAMQGKYSKNYQQKEHM